MSLRINPDMEAYFVGVALAHGTNPLARYGMERVQLSQELAQFMAQHKGETELMSKLRSNFRELGGRLLDTDPVWFYTKLADAYLDWLYGQNALAGGVHPEEAARADSARDTRLESLPQRDRKPWKF